jgi:hypothetical protein
MKIISVKDTILYSEDRMVVMVLLYLKLMQMNICPYNKDLDIITDLYLKGGYNSDTQSEFIEHCIKNKYKRSSQSLRNTLSKYVKLGVFVKPKNKSLHLSSALLPPITYDKLILDLKISHAN